MKILFLILLLFGYVAQASDFQYSLDVGVGNFNSASNGFPEMKMVTVGAEHTLYDALKIKGIGGGWGDTSGSGYSGAAFLAGQVGWEVRLDGLVASVFSGPGLITSTDSLLGSPFEFFSDAHLGIKDEDDNYIGIFFRHISDAGITPVNVGRDIFGLEISF